MTRTTRPDAAHSGRDIIMPTDAPTVADRLRKTATKLLLLTVLAGTVLPTSGCRLLWGLAAVNAEAGAFFWGTPIIPVSPYFSQQVEDTYWEEERYGKVPILDPVEGENAPIFCMDAPSYDQIVRAMPRDPSGGVPFLAETQWNNMEIVVENIVDRLDECRQYPLAGPARQHHCHYKCTVFYDETIRSHWPVPFTHTDRSQEVVYIDKNYLIRCAGPVVGNGL